MRELTALELEVDRTVELLARVEALLELETGATKELLARVEELIEDDSDETSVSAELLDGIASEEGFGGEEALGADEDGDERSVWLLGRGASVLDADDGVESA